MKKLLLALVFGVLVAGIISLRPPAQITLPLEPGDHVVLIGNATAERMQHHGWLESYVQSALPEHRLVFRNHGFSGDTVDERPRSQGFTDPHAYLEISKADVILAFFGYNESFADDPAGYRKKLEEWIADTQGRRYGKGSPRIVLFSPLAYEAYGNPNLPQGTELNRRLAAHAEITRDVAAAAELPFVDLYAISERLYAESSTPLTINGIHLTSEGNRRIAESIAKRLFRLPAQVAQKMGDRSSVDRLRAAVLEKNELWFRRYRAPDGNDVWGGRSTLKFVDGVSNKDVLAHELTMIDVLTANRDQKVWAYARGEYDYRVDDSNVPPPIPVTSNVGGGSASSDANKEGQLRYLSPQETVEQLELANGLEANVFASEEMFPELANPVQMSVDTRGRVWVAAWPTYPKWEPLEEMNDRILILPDDDRDGVADRAIVFAEVHTPTGFEFWGGGVIVASAPDLIYLEDTDGDDRADVRIRILHGLDSADTHHAANNLVYGPDGYIYYQRGVFLVSNVESPWGPPQLDTTSGMYRFNPRTYQFSFHAKNTPNPHGIDFDFWGEHFATDGTGGNAYQVRSTLGGEFKMQPLLKKTVRPVASSGVLSSSHFPPEFDGDFLILNTIGFLGIKRYDLKTDENGDVWGDEAEDLLVSPHDRNFRPTDFVIGDDGALYVSDWQNVIIGHMQHHVRDPNRDHENGRIYRVTAKGRPLSESVSIDGEPIPHLLDLLTSPVNGVRQRARIELSERDSKEVDVALRTWAAQWDPKKKEHAHHLLEALWLSQQHNLRNAELLASVLASPEPRARTAAERVELFWSGMAAGASTDETGDENAPLFTPPSELKRRGFDKGDLKQYERGARVYSRSGSCVTCHQRDGMGLPGTYPPIVDTTWILGDPKRLAKLTLRGLTGRMTVRGIRYASPGKTPPMTGFSELYSDEEIAAVLTYARNTFGNSAQPVSTEQVAAVRASITEWGTPYDVDALLAEHPMNGSEVERFATDGRVGADASGTITFRARDADLIGSMQLESGRTRWTDPATGAESEVDRTNVGYWSRVGDSARWPARVRPSTRYRVSLDYGCPPESIGASFRISVGSKQLDLQLEKATGGWHDYQRVELGELTVGKAASVDVVLSYEKASGQALMNFWRLILEPVK